MEKLMNPQRHETLLNFFRVFGNEDRLRLVVTLMDAPSSTREIAERFAWKEHEALENIAALRSLGLVETLDDSRYQFDIKALYALNRELLARENFPSPIDGWEDEVTRKILRPFFEGQQIINLPENPKKFRLLLDWLVTNFELHVRYTEKEINTIIMRFHEDYATLRRAMVDSGLMQRDHGIYWRVSEAHG
jgi:hypothetical protein